MKMTHHSTTEFHVVHKYLNDLEIGGGDELEDNQFIKEKINNITKRCDRNHYGDGDFGGDDHGDYDEEYDEDFELDDNQIHRIKTNHPFVRVRSFFLKKWWF